MEKEEINRRNKAIAVFMGAKELPTEYYIGYHGSNKGEEREVQYLEINTAPYGIFNDNIYKHLKDNLKYHEKWDWLMPVVEKIEKEGYTIRIMENYCRINQLGISEDRETKIESVFVVVSDYCLKVNPK